MAQLRVRQGFEVRIQGMPEPTIQPAAFSSRVGYRVDDFPGLTLKPKVSEGDRVKTGTPILYDKLHEALQVVSPATGKILEVKRGERRKLLEVIIEVEGEEQFEPLQLPALTSVSRADLEQFLLGSGLWPLLRQHPFRKIPTPGVEPEHIFISAVASEKFDPEPNVVLEGKDREFQTGIDLLTKLTPGKVHLTLPADLQTPCPALANAKNVERHTIVVDNYPAGYADVQAWLLVKLPPKKIVWHLKATDVLALGQLFTQGHFPTERVVALAGSGVQENQRKYYRTRFGVTMQSLTAGKIDEKAEQRLISGSAMTGVKVPADSFLGFRDTVLTVLPEGHQRELLGWLLPGENKYSWSRAFISALFPNKLFDANTNRHGDERPCIQCDNCNTVCPTMVMPQQTFRTVVSGDIERAEKIGLLDCVQCGLCTFVCPSKIEIDTILKQGLVTVQKEG